MAAEGGTRGARTIAIVGYAAQFFYGGWFLFHGLNWWLGFFPEKSFAPGAQGFIPELIRLHIFTLVKLMEVAIGLALLADRFAALAVAAALPITVVIAALNLSKGSAFGISVGVIILTLNLLMAVTRLDRYLPMLAKDAGPPSGRGLRAWFEAGPPPSLSSERLPVPRLALAVLLGVAAPAALTYASIYFAHPQPVIAADRR